MRKVSYLITGQLTEAQTALTAHIEQEFAKIINHHGRWYDCIDMRKFHSKILELNKKSRKAFDGGLYHYQAKNYHIQMYLENRYKNPIIGRFAFEYDDAVFKVAFTKALAISIYNTKTIYPIQTKMICMWLLFSYFNVRDFKPADFNRAFEIAEECLDEDMSELEDSWREIDEWAQENRQLINEANAEKNTRRKFRRNALRRIKHRLHADELEVHHFAARLVRSYSELIEAVSQRYHISERGVKKRAKELGITKDNYQDLEDMYFDAMATEEREDKYYRKQYDKGPYSSREAKEHYLKRFSLFRNFGSSISPMNEEELAEYNAEQAVYEKMEEERKKRLEEKRERLRIEFQEACKKDPTIRPWYDIYIDLFLLPDTDDNINIYSLIPSR